MTPNRRRHDPGKAKSLVRQREAVQEQQVLLKSGQKEMSIDFLRQQPQFKSKGPQRKCSQAPVRQPQPAPDNSPFKVDTGAEVTVISEDQWESLDMSGVKPPTKKLHGPDSKPLNSRGELHATLQYRGKVHSPFLSCNTSSTSIA